MCTAIGQICRYCEYEGHFESCCKKKAKDAKGRYRRDRVRQVDTEEFRQHTEPKEYAFRVTSIQRVNSDVHEVDAVDIDIGGVKVSAVIDSGASCNVMDRNQWENMKTKGVVCESRKDAKPLFAYGSKTPLAVAGTITATVKVTDSRSNELSNVDFIVIEGEGQTLLGRDTAKKLNLLRVGPEVNTVSDKPEDTKQRMLREHKSCFTGLGKLKDFQLEIPIDRDVEPIVQPLRRIPFALRDKLEHKLDELEKLDIIEKASGPSTWVSLVVVIPKGKDDIRLCVDMRSANTAVKRVRYPIPTMAEVLQDMNNSTVFSKLDINLAYHQIELSPNCRDITTFVTHKGLYRYKRLMFGISCAPEMYQRVLSTILQDCQGVENFMDDIVVHGESEKVHNERLNRAIERFKERGFTLNPEKCEFNMSKIVYMEHVLSGKGVDLHEDKVKAIVEARTPQNASEVKSFLGLVNFCAKFIPDLATVNEPLRKLTKKGVPFEWGDDQQKSFDLLKDHMTKADTLGYFDKNAPTQIIADASPVGLGAVLVQKQGQEFRVISYASRSLDDTERRYSQTEKEALAIVWAFERFHVYLYGIQVELLTDHKPLECIYSQKSKPCARIERWVLRLQPYQYKVRYIPGPTNIADALSRLLGKENVPTQVESDDYVYFVAKEATPVAMTTREIERVSSDDPELTEVRYRLLNGKWEKCEYKEYLFVKNELCAIGQLVLRGTRIVIPKALRNRVLTLAHEGHPGIVGMKSRLRPKVWWPGIDKDIERHCKSCYGCQMVGQPSKPEPMSRSELPSAPWQHVAADLLGPCPLVTIYLC